MTSKQLGILGEKIAIDYLKKKGYQILDRNFVPKFISGPVKGEIDIVATPRRSIFDILRGKKNDTTHFIEVKTLTSNEIISPEEKVDFKKQKKLIRIAQKWLTEKKIPFDAKWQIDVIAIKIDLNSKKAKISHFKNAVYQKG